MHPYLAIGLLSLIGCTHSEIGYIHHPVLPGAPRMVCVYLDASLTKSVRQSAHSAIEEWNLALNHQVVLLALDNSIPQDYSLLDPSQSENIIIISEVPITSTFMQEAQRLEPQGVTALAVTYHWHTFPSARIYLLQALDHRSYARVMVLHELGHALGAWSHQDGTLMQSFDGLPCIDRKTLTLVSKALHLQVDNLNYCRR